MEFRYGPTLLLIMALAADGFAASGAPQKKRPADAPLENEALFPRQNKPEEKPDPNGLEQEDKPNPKEEENTSQGNPGKTGKNKKSAPARRKNISQDSQKLLMKGAHRAALSLMGGGVKDAAAAVPAARIAGPAAYARYERQIAEWVAPSYTRKPGRSVVRKAANPDGTRTTFAYRFDEEGKGYRSHQYIDAGKGERGWVELFGGRPVDKRDMPLAQQEIRSRNYVAKMEKYFKDMHERNLPWSKDKITAKTAAVLKDHNPPQLSLQEVMRAFGRGKDVVALPGDPKSSGYLANRTSDPKETGRSKISIAMVAADGREADAHEAALKKFSRLVTQEASKDIGLRDLTAFVTQGVNPKDKFTPSRVSLVLDLADALKPELDKVNRGDPAKGIPGLNEMYKTAAAQGTRESYEERPGLTGFAEGQLGRPSRRSGRDPLLKRVANRAVAKNAAKKLPRAEREMAQAREQVLQTAATQVTAEVLKAARETAQNLREENIGSYDVILVGQKTGDAYRKEIPGGIVFIFPLDGKTSKEEKNYLLNLSQSDLKDARRASIKAAVYVEFAKLSQDNRLSSEEIDRVVIDQVSRAYGLTSGDAAQKARELGL